MLHKYHKKYLNLTHESENSVDISILLALFEKYSTFRNSSDIRTIFTQTYM